HEGLADVRAEVSVSELVVVGLPLLVHRNCVVREYALRPFAHQVRLLAPAVGVLRPVRLRDPLRLRALEFELLLFRGRPAGRAIVLPLSPRALVVPPGLVLLS